MIKNQFFHFYFFIQDISLTIDSTYLLFSGYVKNIHLEGIVSQNLNIGLSSHFMTKKGKIFVIFYKYFSRFHKKNKLRPKSKIWSPPYECFL